jgi:hypothetical protein
MQRQKAVGGMQKGKRSGLSRNQSSLARVRSDHFFPNSLGTHFVHLFVVESNISRNKIIVKLTPKG